MTKDEMKNRISMALKDPILQQGFECICKENAELKKACDETQELLDKQIEATYKLDVENAELKAKYDTCLGENTGLKIHSAYVEKKLTKAKEIIREFVEWANWQGNSKCPSFKSIQDKAEQFLKEIK